MILSKWTILGTQRKRNMVKIDTDTIHYGSRKDGCKDNEINIKEPVSQWQQTKEE